MSEAVLIIVLALVIVEAVLSVTWNHAYFRFGIVLFNKCAPFQQGRTSAVSGPVLQQQFDEGFRGQKMLFREIEPGMIAFRERLFNVGFKAFRYFPVMHGIMVTDTSRGKVVVKGIANWSFFVFFAYFVLISVPVLMYSWNGLVLPVALVAISFVMYWIQKRRFEELLSLVIKEWS